MSIDKDTGAKYNRLPLFNVLQSSVEPIFCADKNGSIIFLNREAEELFGYSSAELTGSPVSSIITEPSLESFEQTACRLEDSGRTEETEQPVEMSGRGKNGGEFSFKLSMSMTEIDGERFFTAFVRESRVKIQDRRNFWDNRLINQAVMENMQTGVLVIDKNGCIAFSNTQVAKMLGYEIEEITGMRFFSFFKDVQIDILKKQLVSCRTGSCVKHDYDLREKDGSFMRSSLDFIPVNGADSIFICSLIMVTDISEIKAQEKNLKASQNDMAQVQKIARVGIWAWNIVKDECTWSDGIFSILGVRPQDIKNIDRQTFLEFVHPDDREIVENSASLALRRGNAETEFRINKPDGSICIVRATGQRLVDIYGAPVKIAFIIQDISSEKHLYKQVERIGSMNELILESTSEGIYSLDTQGKVSLLNPAAAEMLGFTPEEVIGKSSHDLWHYTRPDGTTYDEKKCKIYAAYKDGKTHQDQNEIFWRKDGTSFPVEYLSNPIIEEGELIGAVISFNDISERKHSEEIKGRMTRTLGLLNRVSQVLIHGRNEVQMLQDICETINIYGGFDFTWIGLLDNEKGQSIKPIAWHNKLPAQIVFSKKTAIKDWCEENPAGLSIRTGEIQVVNCLKEHKCHDYFTETFKNRLNSCISIPLIHEHRLIGVLSIYSQKNYAFTDEEPDMLSTLADDISYSICSIRETSRRIAAEEKLNKNFEKLRRTVDGITLALTFATEKRDPYTAGHQRNVSKIASAIGRELHLTEDKIDGIFTAGSLHDIGKLSIPADILTNPRILSDIELDMIRIHPEAGFEILREVAFPWPVAKIVLQHHERIDGSGYPSGISGNDVILEARIIGVADVVEAMSAHRPYRPALGIDRAIEEISDGRGKIYDSNVADACINLYRNKELSFLKNEQIGSVYNSLYY